MAHLKKPGISGLMILAHWGMPCQVVSPGNCRLRKSIFSVSHDCAFLRRNTVKNAAITPKAIPPNAAGSGHWGPGCCSGGGVSCTDDKTPASSSEKISAAAFSYEQLDTTDSTRLLSAGLEAAVWDGISVNLEERFSYSPEDGSPGTEGFDTVFSEAGRLLNAEFGTDASLSCQTDSPAEDGSFSTGALTCRYDVNALK